jgi:hypothetical protein
MVKYDQQNAAYADFIESPGKRRLKVEKKGSPVLNFHDLIVTIR